MAFLLVPSSHASECKWDQDNLKVHWKKHAKEMKNIASSIVEYEEYSLKLCNDSLNGKVNPDIVSVCDYNSILKIVENVFYGIDVPIEIETIIRNMRITGIYDSMNQLFIPTIPVDDKHPTVNKIMSMYKIDQASFQDYCSNGHEKVIERKGPARHQD